MTESIQQITFGSPKGREILAGIRILADPPAGKEPSWRDYIKATAPRLAHEYTHFVNISSCFRRCVSDNMTSSTSETAFSQTVDECWNRCTRLWSHMTETGEGCAVAAETLVRAVVERFL